MSLPTPILQYNLAEATVKDLLPEGYTPLAYIESTGTQWIDTGWIPTGNTQEVTIIFSPTASLENKSVCGSQPSMTTPRNLILHTGNYFYTADNYITCTSYNNPGDKYVVRMTNNVNSKLATVNINGNNTNLSYTSTALTTTYTYHIFTNNNGGNKTAQASSIKIYYCDIINNGTQFCELKPCRRDSDGVIGMYDLVSRTFKTNSGAGSFIAGPELAIGKGEGTSLPEEYQQVEYLESPNGSTTYIDTGLKATATTGTRILYSNPNYDSSKENIFYGASSTLMYGGGANYYMEVYNPPYWAFGNNCIGIDFSCQDNVLYDIKINYNGDSKLYINGQLMGTRTGQTSFPNYNLYIFGRNVAGSPDTQYSKYRNRIHNLKIWNGTTIQRNFVPCYRKSDMKPGMYDVINRVFYTNAGSGEFVLGPTITNIYTIEPNAQGGSFNYFKFLESGRNTTLYGKTGFTATFTSNDTYNILNTYPLIEGTTYTISCDVSGLPSGAYWDFNLWNSENYQWRLTNGHNIKTFTVNTSLIPDYNQNDYTTLSRFLWDDGARSTPDNSSVIRVENVKIIQGVYDQPKQATYTNISGIYDSTKGWSAKFNGSNSKLHSYIDLVSILNTRVWTISFWFNPSALPASSNPSDWDRIILYRKAGTSDYQGKQLVVYLTHTGIGTSFYSDDTEKEIPGLAINNWYHIVITQNGDTSTVYANGTSLGTMSKYNLDVPTGSYLQIGYDEDRGMGAFNGKLSNIMIFDSVLTDAQVKELYGQ